MYEYKAIVTKVYDGDTITCDIDLGFNMLMQKQKIRLSAINAPEIKGESRERGLESRDYLRDLILGKEVLLKTEKDKAGKYGRWLATVFVGNELLLNVNDMLVEANHADPYIV